MTTRRRARRVVVSGLAAVAVAQLGLNVALDTVRPNWRDAEYGHRVRRLARQRRGDPAGQPLLVVLGTSRAQMGVSPALFGLGDGVRAFNLSMGGAVPVRQVFNFDRLCAAGLAPDYLLVEVFPALLAEDGSADGAIPADTLALADLPRVAGECDDFPAYRRRWLAGRLAPWHTHRRLLLDHWDWAGDTFLPPADRRTFLWAETRPDGWMPYYNPAMPAADREARTAGVEGAYGPTLRAFPAPPRPARVYRRMIAAAAAGGGRVAVLLMPESPRFRRLYPPGGWAESRRRVRAIAGDWPVVDAGDWLDDETDFADGHHLLGHAAERFSRRLGAEWVRGWVGGP